jgi:hypothetical protein
MPFLLIPIIAVGAFAGGTAFGVDQTSEEVKRRVAQGAAIAVALALTYQLIRRG